MRRRSVEPAGSRRAGRGRSFGDFMDLTKPANDDREYHAIWASISQGKVLITHAPPRLK